MAPRIQRPWEQKGLELITDLDSHDYGDLPSSIDLEFQRVIDAENAANERRMFERAAPESSKSHKRTTINIDDDDVKEDKGNRTSREPKKRKNGEQSSKSGKRAAIDIDDDEDEDDDEDVEGEKKTINGKLEDRAQRNHCKRDYAYDSHKNGTNSYNRHMKACKVLLSNADISKVMLNSEARLQARKIDHMIFHEMVAKCIIQHDLPFAYVEYERVRSVWKYLNAYVKFISWNTAEANVYKLYENEIENLKRELAHLPGRISFTSDLWTAIPHEGYMCLTTHYVDRNWKLNSKIIVFYAFPPPHSAHILNIIVQIGLKDIDDTLEKIRESIKYVQAYGKCEILFAKCVEVVGLQLKAWLIMDMRTRWNSTYKMLDRTLKYRAAFGNLKVIDGRNYKFHPTEAEWHRLKQICEFLEPFDEITNLISVSSYPTSNLYFMQIWKINNWLISNSQNQDEVIRSMIVPMRERFDKYWEEVSDVFAMTTMFDPRLKLTQDFINFRKQTVVTSGKSSLEMYLDDPPIDMTQYESLDILNIGKITLNSMENWRQWLATSLAYQSKQ
ncbi:PREDICTED: zinc finger BED domain-containing protein RICESLEEPER 1-like [Camelina sativa]|uniref:Zinc finger BED domain-containing protein RICESLEEPER 1-like n=1 Tax=Camelina sativa TaxID=90675 RepID=A0ABM0TT42_CAMSA|nr:PREDICTED: zinc finger BED domain-containing protein RICESLEEPER 1-like [Camelina sativa]